MGIHTRMPTPNINYIAYISDQLARNGYDYVVALTMPDDNPANCMLTFTEMATTQQRTTATNFVKGLDYSTAAITAASVWKIRETAKGIMTGSTAGQTLLRNEYQQLWAKLLETWKKINQMQGLLAPLIGSLSVETQAQFDALVKASIDSDATIAGVNTYIQG